MLDVHTHTHRITTKDSAVYKIAENIFGETFRRQPIERHMHVNPLFFGVT